LHGIRPGWKFNVLESALSDSGRQAGRNTLALP
jgi:hypothetical protein